MLTQSLVISRGYLLVSACNAFLMDEGAAIGYHDDKYCQKNYFDTSAWDGWCFDNSQIWFQRFRILSMFISTISSKYIKWGWINIIPWPSALPREARRCFWGRARKGRNIKWLRATLYPVLLLFRAIHEIPISMANYKKRKHIIIDDRYNDISEYITMSKMPTFVPSIIRFIFTCLLFLTSKQRKCI